MSKCNIFKPLASNTGEFLTFQQYTDDITRSLAEGAGYRVVPSRFAALNLKIKDMFGDHSARYGLPKSNDTGKPCLYLESEHEVSDPNIILPQIFQSHYENACAIARDMMDPSSPNYDEAFAASLGRNTGEGVYMREVTTELLWSTLRRFGMIGDPVTPEGYPNTLKVFNEVMYVGDINIHSNRSVDTYHYNEIYCYIPTAADSMYYNTETLHSEVFPGDNIKEETPIQGWNQANYPIRYPLMMQAVVDPGSASGAEQAGNYSLANPILKCLYDDDPDAVNRHNELAKNVEFDFNAIVVFYDVYNNPLDSDDYTILHRCRPMGIYFTGPVSYADDGTPNGLKNTVTKYITNDDIFGQGSAFGLRIMSRFVPTPNSSSYMFTDTEAVEDKEGRNSYETLAQVMGKIADAIVDMNHSYKDSRDIAQEYKNHLALFRNNRTNVPYPRMVNGIYYWFVNGRNTGQRCTEIVQAGDVHSTDPIWQAIIPAPTEDTFEEWCDTHCLKTSDKFNGWCFLEKEDINPYSATYGMIRMFKEWDEHWLLLNESEVYDDPVWEAYGEHEPVIRMSLKNKPVRTGLCVIHYKNVAENPDPNQMSKTETVACAEHPADSVVPVWVRVSASCELNSFGKRTGYQILQEEDKNEYSDSFGDTRTRRVYNPTECPVDVEEYTVVVNYDSTMGIVAIGGGKDGNVFVKNTSCTLEASAAKGYTFIRWENEKGETKTSNPYSFVVTDNRELKAIFAKVEEPRYTVRCSFNASIVKVIRNGRAVSAASTYTFEASKYTEAELSYEAIPNSDKYKIVGWSINGTKVTNDAKLIVTPEQCRKNGTITIEPIVDITDTNTWEIYSEDGELWIMNTSTGYKGHLANIGTVADKDIIILRAESIRELGGTQISYTNIDGDEIFITANGVYADFNKKDHLIETIITVEDINDTDFNKAVYTMRSLNDEGTRKRVTQKYQSGDPRWYEI